MRTVNIQIQDVNGNWLTIQSLFGPTENEVSIRMRETSKFHPNKRVRAVEQNGTVVDIL